MNYIKWWKMDDWWYATDGNLMYAAPSGQAERFGLAHFAGWTPEGFAASFKKLESAPPPWCHPEWNVSEGL